MAMFNSYVSLPEGNYSFMVVHRIFGNGRSIDIFPFQRYAATLKTSMFHGNVSACWKATLDDTGRYPIYVILCVYRYIYMIIYVYIHLFDEYPIQYP